MISIIIPSYNDADYLPDLIKSIKRKTIMKDYEIIVINNGSNDRNSKIIDSLTGINAIRINRENKGFPAACNQGIKEAKINNADFVFILNADMKIETKGWLSRMMGASVQKSDAGILGTSSNYIANKDQDNKTYSTDTPDFIETKWIGLGLSFIPMKVIDKVGPIDENFGYGGCDDLDYSIRVRKAGYKLYVVTNVSIWHKGMVSNKQLPLSYREILKNNREYLKKKWPEEYAWVTA
jgi:GT2 family glycosyltransferase